MLSTETRIRKEVEEMEGEWNTHIQQIILITNENFVMNLQIVRDLESPYWA